MIGINADGDQLLLGRGKVYLDRFVNGVKTGERFVGECGSFELTGAPETKDKYTMTEPGSGLLKRAVVRQTWEFGFELDEFDKENLALALLGEVDEDTQSTTPITDEPVGPEGLVQGRWYQLAAIRVGSFSFSAPGSCVEGTDYVLDAANGRVYIVPGGIILTAGLTSATVDYTPEAAVVATIAAGATPIIEAKLTFIGNNVVGPNYKLEAWKCSITLDGGLAFLSDDYAAPKFKGTVLLDSTGHPDSPYFTATVVTAEAA